MLTIAVTCAAANATANKAIVKNSILLLTEFMVFPLYVAAGCLFAADVRTLQQLKGVC
jgi:hypothetical protein